MPNIIPFDQLQSLGETLRNEVKTVVFTNGHFDLLHVGHLRYLQAAAGLGDILVVGVNDDAVTKERKGAGRPILPEGERAELVAGLRCVDYVVVFHEPTAERSVELLRPDIYVKGGDYRPGGAPLPEASVVESYGGRVEILPLVEGRSTSEIVAAIKAGRGVQ